MKKIAIIGTGMCGLTVARELQQHALVTLYEKARSVGGRLATRYYDEHEFDHGAQFFTASTGAFQSLLTELLQAGVIARWDAKFAEFDGEHLQRIRQWQDTPTHYVGVPRMNAVAKYLSQGLDIRLSTQVLGMIKVGNKWQLQFSNSLSDELYDWIISTAPLEQTLTLLPLDYQGRAVLAEHTMQGCYALMLGFSSPLSLPFDAALIKRANISWISVNSAKPQRPAGFSLLVLASNHWADEHLNGEESWIIEQLLTEASRITQLALDKAALIKLHPWRYANVRRHAWLDDLLDTKLQLAAAGDWCHQGRVEAAYLAGIRLAKQLSKLN